MPGRLEGRRVLVLRPVGQAASLAAALRAEGAEPVVTPAIRILPNDVSAALATALSGGCAWTLFTSVNGVAAALPALAGPRRPALGRVAAVGPVTAEALVAAGIAVDFVPSAFTTEALARELPRELAPDAPGEPSGRVCVVRAEAAGDDLECILAERGFGVARVDAYRTEPAGAAAIARALEAGVDAVALTSASITDAFASASAGIAGPVPALVSIGPATSAAARRAKLTVAAEASPHTTSGLVEALARHLRQPGSAR